MEASGRHEFRVNVNESFNLYDYDFYQLCFPHVFPDTQKKIKIFRKFDFLRIIYQPKKLRNQLIIFISVIIFKVLVLNIFFSHVLKKRNIHFQLYSFLPIFDVETTQHFDVGHLEFILDPIAC